MANNNNDETDDVGDLLRKFYKPKEEINSDLFWDNVSKKIDSLFHKEIFTSKVCHEDGILLSDEEKYWLGLEEYINNKTSSLQHKNITDHILTCKECRKNYNDLLDKKKVFNTIEQLSLSFA